MCCPEPWALLLVLVCLLLSYASWEPGWELPLAEKVELGFFPWNHRMAWIGLGWVGLGWTLKITWFQPFLSGIPALRGSDRPSPVWQRAAGLRLDKEILPTVLSQRKIMKKLQCLFSEEDVALDLEALLVGESSPFLLPLLPFCCAL